MPNGQLGRDDSHHSGLVMTESTTVPGGGLDSWPLKSANIRLFILFFTTTTVNLGLCGEMSLKEGRGGETRQKDGEGRERKAGWGGGGTGEIEKEGERGTEGRRERGNERILGSLYK